MGRALVLAVTLGGAAIAAAVASAHVAPSVDDNNRYLKLTPLGDRVRLAYVIFYGEVPGARLRPAIDADGDGAISDAESRAFGAKLGGELAAALEVSVDGARQRLAWAEISVGMGSPRVAAGSFSVDFVAYLCVAAARGRHEVRLFDRFRVPRPGETEVKIEDSPGVRIERAMVGELSDASGSFRFAGPGGPLSESGLLLAFAAGDQALVPADGACSAARAGAGTGAGRPSAGAIAAAAAGLGCALAGAAAVLVLRRRRHHSART
jgi:hypothetical protein